MVSIVTAMMMGSLHLLGFLLGLSLIYTAMRSATESQQFTVTANKIAAHKKD